MSIGSATGKKYAEDFEIKGVPAFLFAENLKSVKKNRQPFVAIAKDFLTHKKSTCYLHGSKVGIPFSKFITPPKIDLEGEPVLGEGPIQIVEFTDFQCPFCKRFYDQNKALIARLVEENKIQYIIKDFPLHFHPEAKPLQAAANCVLKTEGIDGYEEFKALVFENQKNWSGAGTDKAATIAAEYAAKIGASTRNLKNCMTSEAVLSEIENDMKEGAKYGVSGTPGVFVGTQIIPGAVGPEVLEAAVEAELNATRP